MATRKSLMCAKEAQSRARIAPNSLSSTPLQAGALRLARVLREWRRNPDAEVQVAINLKGLLLFTRTMCACTHVLGACSVLVCIIGFGKGARRGVQIMVLLPEDLGRIRPHILL